MKSPFEERPWLILHKVRGEPAFDIAIRLEPEIEETWIIPTSGHRAYPMWKKPLDIILDDAGTNLTFVEDIFPNWPDHYQVAAQPQKRAAPRTYLLKELEVTEEELAEALAAIKKSED